jgi:hypothetical protein
LLQTWAVYSKGISSVSLKNGLHASFRWSNAQKECKRGCGYTKFVHDTGAFRRHKNTKKTATCWVFTFNADTLAATDWLVALIGRTICGLYMIPQCLYVLMLWYLQFMHGEGKTLNTKLGCEIFEYRPFSIETIELL